MALHSRCFVKFACMRPFADVRAFALAACQAFLDSLDISSPTEVQAASIPKVLEGRNVGIQCYTGSGKVRRCGPAPCCAQPSWLH